MSKNNNAAQANVVQVPRPRGGRRLREPSTKYTSASRRQAPPQEL
jgi:hypothetical protein